MDEKLFLSYNDYYGLLVLLLEKIESSSLRKNFKYIHGIPRGGLPIAIHLSHHLGLEFVENMSRPIHEYTLVVDDIADTGITLEKYPLVAATATLFYKKRSSVKPTFYILETNKWVVFPWEKTDEEPNRPPINI